MDKARFRASDHTYWLGDNELISVTTLLRKHGLAPDYSFVDKQVLATAADYGTRIHKEVEVYIKTGLEGLSDEFLDYLRISRELGLYAHESEVLVNNHFVAGQFDLAAKRKVEGKEIRILADIKTTLNLNKESVRWQLSIYEYLHEQLYGYGFDELYIFHLRSNGKSNAHKVERISRSELLRLFECERKGEIYTPPSLDDRLLEEAEKIEVEYQLLKARRAEISIRLLKEMQEKQLMRADTERISVSYISPSVRTGFDMASFERDYPELKKQYLTETIVKENLRISLKK